MTTPDPLLTDDLAALLRQFPSHALRELLASMSVETLSPFTERRASSARAAPPDADLRDHADAIAGELLWWGSHDVRCKLGQAIPDWPSVLAMVAKNQGLKQSETDRRPAWVIEQALLKHVFAEWENLTPAQRERAMRDAGVGLDAARGGAAAAAGGAFAAAEAIMVAGGPRLAAFIAGRVAPLAVLGPAAPFLGPVLTVLGTAWSLYDLAGPAYRVLRPATLLVAFTRKKLRDERISSSFQD